MLPAFPFPPFRFSVSPFLRFSARPPLRLPTFSTRPRRFCVHTPNLVSPLNPRLPPTKSPFVQLTPLHRIWRGAVPLFLQALFWFALTIAFAMLLRLAGVESWATSMRFSALNWMPWAVMAPIVFWFSRRFPLERGRLWSSLPAHVVGCAVCVFAMLWGTAYVAYVTRPARLDERPFPVETHTTEAAAASASTARPAPSRRRDFEYRRGEHADRFGHHERRVPFGRPRPFSWPFLGTTLLRANFDAAMYLIVAIAAHALSLYRRTQERDRQAIALTAGLNRAKLDALRLQLQPHFLFNTLNAIATLVHRDAAAADELIGDLSELLRLSLQTVEHEVPLARELDLLDCYLAIEQTRLGERLRVVRNIDPAALNALVPTFVLQPVVENAIRHGIEPRLAPGTVTVSARREGDRLRLTVADDGIGLKPPVDGATRRGIGISNTEARLRALHGEEAALVFLAPPEGGVTVEITLPYSTVPRADLPAAATSAPLMPPGATPVVSPVPGS